MITITAVIRAKPGHEEAVERALRDVAAHVAANEPETVGYFVSRSLDTPGVFTTYERFTDRAAMERHSDSVAVARFLREVESALDGDIVLYTSNEISAK